MLNPWFYCSIKKYFRIAAYFFGSCVCENPTALQRWYSTHHQGLFFSPSRHIDTAAVILSVNRVHDAVTRGGCRCSDSNFPLFPSPPPLFFYVCHPHASFFDRSLFTIWTPGTIYGVTKSCNFSRPALGFFPHNHPKIPGFLEISFFFFL